MVEGWGSNTPSRPSSRRWYGCLFLVAVAVSAIVLGRTRRLLLSISLLSIASTPTHQRSVPLIQCSNSAIHSDATTNASALWNSRSSNIQAIITPENVLWSQNWHRYALSSCKNSSLPLNYLAVGKFTEKKFSSEQLLDSLPNCTGGYVWVRLASNGISNVQVFAKDVVTNMKQSFALITTDGDYSVPSRVPSYQAILDHPLCTAWYTQNYDGSVEHPKFRPIPIGFDLHTHWPGLWSPPKQIQDNLDHMLRLRREGLDHTNYRSEAIFVPPWATKQRHPDRTVAPKILDQCNITHVHGPNMPINELWGNYTRYRFALSPFGHGMDTHRTWELLFFGAIPIVKTSSLDVLYEGLPVIIVQEYSDICKDHYLEAAWACVEHLWPARDEVFTMDWWLDKRWNPNS